MTPTQRAAMEQAAKFCEAWPSYGGTEAADALRAALAEPEPAQEPVAWLEYARKKPALRRLVFERTSDKALAVDGWVSEPLSQSAQQPRKAVKLTHQQITECHPVLYGLDDDTLAFARTIE